MGFKFSQGPFQRLVSSKPLVVPELQKPNEAEGGVPLAQMESHWLYKDSDPLKQLVEVFYISVTQMYPSWDAGKSRTWPPFLRAALRRFEVDTQHDP